MQPDEMLVDISFPALSASQRGTFIKLGLRRAQAVAVVNVAAVLTLQGEGSNGNGYPRVRAGGGHLGLGRPDHHPFPERRNLPGRARAHDAPVIEHAASLAMQDCHPIDDVRSSADYRREMVRVCTLRALRGIAAGEERNAFPAQPVLLWGSQYTGRAPRLEQSSQHPESDAIETTINGQPYTFHSGQDKTLLRLLREDAGLMARRKAAPKVSAARVPSSWMAWRS